MPLKNMEDGVEEWEETNSWSGESRFFVYFRCWKLSNVISFLISRTTEQQQSYCYDLVGVLGSLQYPAPFLNCDFELLRWVEISARFKVCVASKDT